MSRKFKIYLLVDATSPLSTANRNFRSSNERSLEVIDVMLVSSGPTESPAYILILIMLNQSVSHSETNCTFLLEI